MPDFPALFQAWTEPLRQNMLQHPQHHLGGELRQQFYDAVGSGTKEARAFRGWLAVLCVQKVLPILLAVDPTDRAPFDEVSACISRLLGATSPHDLLMLENDNYHGNWVNMQCVTGKTPENALAVRMSSFKAMLEIKAWDSETGWEKPFDGTRVLDEHGQTVTVNDEYWVGMAGWGDGAGAAAVAWACSAESKACDPERLKQFWTWWLDEAWPQAAYYAAELPGRFDKPLQELYPSSSDWPDVDVSDLPF